MEEEMATVHADPEVIRDMKSLLNKTINEINNACQKINGLRNSSGQWNDEKGEVFRNLMQVIEGWIKYPIPTLQATQQKLEKLAQALDSYNRV